MIQIVTMFNKPDYMRECLQCVIDQTRTDYVHIVASDNIRDFEGRFPPCVWVNEQWKRAEPDDYCIWLSDDDYWYPTFLEETAGYLDNRPDLDAVYAISKHVLFSLEQGEIKIIRHLGGAHTVFDENNDPSGKIDGGQVLVRRRVLDKISYPYQPEETQVARLSDALYLSKLAEVTSINPVGSKPLMENRTTPVSGHTRAADDTYEARAYWK